jgi:hypothetical protein
VKSLEDLFLQRIEELLEPRRVAACSGRPSDFAEYQRIVGVIEGLTAARNEFTELADRFRASLEE